MSSSQLTALIIVVTITAIVVLYSYSKKSAFSNWMPDSLFGGPIPIRYDPARVPGFEIVRSPQYFDGI
jgi:hypothetical protein